VKLVVSFAIAIFAANFLAAPFTQFGIKLKCMASQKLHIQSPVEFHQMLQLLSVSSRLVYCLRAVMDLTTIKGVFCDRHASGQTRPAAAVV
jgi:HKD family nuclease